MLHAINHPEKITRAQIILDDLKAIRLNPDRTFNIRARLKNLPNNLILRYYSYGDHREVSTMDGLGHNQIGLRSRCCKPFFYCSNPAIINRNNKYLQPWGGSRSR